MADIALLASTASTRAGVTISVVSLSVEESIEQATLPLAADTPAGTPVYIDTNGRFARSNAGASGTAKAYGITVKSGKAGEPRTAIAKGILGGHDFSTQALGASIYLSDTLGKLADAAGTNSVKVGIIMPIRGQARGNAPLKALRVNL